MARSFFDENTLEDLLDEIEYVYLSDTRPWVIGYSGGKDSTLVLQLVYQMLLRLDAVRRSKPVYVVSSDTMVENPIIKDYLVQMSKLVNESAARDRLPLTTTIVIPDPMNSFWTNVIGRGFPTPRTNGTFRWCTERLKILPSSGYIEKIIKEKNTEVVILLGVRKDESIARKKRIEGREIMGRLLNRHETIKQAYVYPPIVDLTTDDVWRILLSDNGATPWGSDNRRLVELYSDADSGECPFAGISNRTEQTQSCGKSRFGCWICTVVTEDKSLNGFIRSGHRELIPLAEFRKWLMSIRDLPEYREKKRRDGKVYTTKSGELGFGPFTWEARQMILRRLLALQQSMQHELITQAELRAIDRIWDDELDLTRRTLVELYRGVTGESLPWHDYKKPLYDEETITRIQESAKQADVHVELIQSMILTTIHNKYYSNPKLLRTSLEKQLSQQWLHAEVLKEIENEV